MWDKILELAIGDGLWALLFCILLIYELKDSRARESKYQETITSLTKDLEYMKDIDENIENMNNAVREYMEDVAKEERLEQQRCPRKKSEVTPEVAKESA
ncbi:MAG: hypothetical protein K2M75_01930 [Clostridia bacterium]|nr:hypothetical protein [Clostridia bacterium]